MNTNMLRLVDIFSIHGHAVSNMLSCVWWPLRLCILLVNSFFHLFHQFMHPSIILYIYPSIHLVIHPFTHSSIHHYIHLFTSIHPFICLSIHSFGHPSIHFYSSIYLSMYPSICSCITY